MRVWLEYPNERAQPGRAVRQERLSRMASPDAILEAVEAEAARAGHILMGVRVDGVEMDAEAFCSLTGDHEAVFTLTPLTALLRESLDSALAYCRRLKDALDVIADRAEGGEMSPALSGVSQIFDGLTWLADIYDRCRFFTPAPFRPEEEAALKTELLSALNSLLDLAAQRDLAGVARALREVLRPRVETLLYRLKFLGGLRLDPQ